MNKGCRPGRNGASTGTRLRAREPTDAAGGIAVRTSAWFLASFKAGLLGRRRFPGRNEVTQNSADAGIDVGNRIDCLR